MGGFMKVHGRKARKAREMKRAGGDMAMKKKGKKKSGGKMNRQAFIDRAEDALGDQPL